MAGERRLIYTLGMSTRSAEEFLALLLTYGVEAVADVRKFPTSRFEHFRREELGGLLDGAGIEYLYMGKELGGYRPSGYQNFTATPTFQEGLGRLEEIATKKRTAIVCAERFPWRCHRRFIALALEERGWEVVHIIEPGRVWLSKKRQGPRLVT